MTQAERLINALRASRGGTAKRRWTDEELNILKSQYADADIDEIAQAVGRNRSSVAKMASTLGLRRSSQCISETRKRAAKPNAGSFKPVHGRSWNGKRRTDPTYNSWLSMHQRCSYPQHKSYQSYGGRGIFVCGRWSDFQNFLADMGDRPAGMTLGRIDNSGPYAPWNCRWESAKDQQRNRRSNRLIEFNGVTKTLIEWSEETGIHADTIAYRIRNGWPVHSALSESADRGRRLAVVKG